MKPAENKKILVAVSKSELLSLVATRLKDRVLFSESIKDAKKYLQKAEIKIK